MKNTAIFYGPIAGRTEQVAQRIQEEIGKDYCDLVSIDGADISDLETYSNLIFGIATIGTETWQSDPVKSGWFEFMPKLEEADLSDKKIALYGLGDQVRWPLHFVDAMGELYKLLQSKGYDTVGKVATEGYTFEESEAVHDNMFAGLPIDEDFQPDLTEGRIKDWVSTLKKEFS